MSCLISADCLYSNSTRRQVCTPTTTVDNSSTCTLAADVDVTDIYCFQANVTSQFLGVSTLSDEVCWELITIGQRSCCLLLTSRKCNNYIKWVWWTFLYRCRRIIHIHMMHIGPLNASASGLACHDTTMHGQMTTATCGLLR